MKHIPAVVAAFSIAALTFGLGYKLGAGNERPVPPSLVEQAQKASFFGADPNWLGQTDSEALFRAVRDRAYAFCFKKGQIGRHCAALQDEAVQFSIAALLIAQAQQRMPNKEELGLKEHWVATNPEIVPRVLNECWALYREHGAQDARILSVCLGNLTDASPIVPLPIP